VGRSARLGLQAHPPDQGTDADKTAGKADYDKFMEDVRTNMSEAVLSARIKSMGMTMEQFKVRKLDDSICSAVFDREVKSKIDIAAETVKKFYEDNPDKFEKPERVRASHILISTLDKDQNPLPEDQKRQKEKLARDIKAKADKGEDFAALAKQYSEDPGSKDTGGEYTFGRGEMVPAFETAAFSLKTNQISDLVETRFGYHIIKLSEKIPGGKVAIAEVSDKIKDYLLQKEVYNRLEGYRAQIEKEAEVKFIGIKEPPKPDDLDISSLVPSAPSTNSANGADKK
jgi:parvulin-like peptidyl-prolyl isomerase